MHRLLGARAALPTLPLFDQSGDEGRFAVGRIICVGRNYAAHAREMGHDPEREAPFFFMKPYSCLAAAGEVPYPSATADLHHEIELVVALGRGAAELAVDESLLDGLAGCGVGLDLTRRDLQARLKSAGHPWEAAKVFPGAAVCGPLQALASGVPGPEASIALWRDGHRVQAGVLGQMIWSVAEVLAEVAELFDLLPGDLVFTGTPAGVGPVRAGEVLQGHIDGLRELTCRIV